MTFGDKALQVLKTVAPTIATAVGGPFAGMAVTALTGLFGTKPGDQKGLEAAVLGATPDQLVQLQKINNDFQVQMKQLGVTEEQLEYTDVASARAREEAVKDWTPTILAIGVTIGFFGILSYMLVYGIPKNSGGEALLVMLGSLGTAWTAVIGYYFGSSIGARRSAEALAQIAKQP